MLDQLQTFEPATPGSAFDHELYSAFRVLGLNASPRHDGGLTCCCPRCVQPTRLTLSPNAAACPDCHWHASGEAWEIARAAASVAVQPVTEGDGLPLWTLEQILSYKPDPASQIWTGGILTAGDAAAIVGAPGVGKSRLALQAAVCTILGRPFLGWETRGADKRWLFLQTENNGERLQYDLQRMTAMLTKGERKRVSECLRILKIDALEFGSICMAEGHADRARISQTLATYDPHVAVIDPLRDAGRGDPNKDEVMAETCQSIGAVVRANAPKRTPLIIHHGRTGAVESSKVWGDDAASFGRNSKVLYGWLRSQINVAAAGVAHEGVVVVGCGKCSNGRRWEPFAARLCERTMNYVRLTKEEFDVEEWAGTMSGTSRKRRKVTPEEVAEVLARSGGCVRGGINAPHGLAAQIRRAYGCTKDEAIAGIESALGETAEYADEKNPKGQPARVYYLKNTSASVRSNALSTRTGGTGGVSA